MRSTGPLAGGAFAPSARGRLAWFVRPHLTMQLVSAGLIDETWRAVGASSPAAIRQLQKQCGKDHEELTGFMLGFTSDLRPEALGLALYVHVVVSHAFRRSGTKFRRIRPGRIERTWAANSEFIDGLKTSGYSRTAIPNEALPSSEPAVLRYVIDALTEEGQDPVELSDGEFWHILRVLKTVVDCLHDAGIVQQSAA